MPHIVDGSSRLLRAVAHGARALACALVVALLVAWPHAAAAQLGSSTDIIAGTVLGPGDLPLSGATVQVTSIETGITRSKTTNDKGQFTLLFPDGGGQYRIVVRFLGMAPQERTIARVADEDRLMANFTLSAAPAQLEAVTVQATRMPRPGADERPTPGSTGRTLTGDQLQRLPVDPSDPNAIALLAPGVVGLDATDTTAAGFSIAGQRPDQNLVTLDGLTFEAGTVPAEAVRNTRVVTNTYDVARGQFTGGMIQTTTRGGTNDVAGSFSYSLRDPSLQWSDEQAEGTFSQGYTQHQLSGGLGGPIAPNRAFWFASGQVRRRLNPLQSILGVDALTLDRLGAAPDSVARFLSALETFGLPPSVAAVPDDRLTDNGSVITRVDVQLDENHSLMLRGNLQGSVQNGFRTSALTVPSYGGEQSSQGAGGMVTLSSVLGTFLNELRASFGYDERRGDPYLLIPEGRVRVSSELADGSIGVSSLAFGGNPALPTDGTSSQLEVTNELSLLGFNGHRYKLGGLLNYSRFTTMNSSDRFGSFTFNSLEAFEAGTPASFTRTLAPAEREGAMLNAALYLGDTWRASQALQMTYGARLEHSRFMETPAYNPQIDAIFGRRTDEIPSEVHVSPRLGFTWILGTGSVPDGGGPARGMGGRGGVRGGGRGGAQAFQLGAGSNLTVLRGGIGEFRGRTPTQLFSSALDATGLPADEQRLVCIGPAVPAPDWSAYLLDPSAIPASCADGSGGAPVATRRPVVTVFDPSFGAPRAWRGSLGVTRRIGRFGVNVDASYAFGMNLYGVRDLNLRDDPAFVLEAEGGRPVFAPSSSIDASTGATSVLASREHPEFAQVLDMRSDLESRTTQVTLGVNGIAWQSLLWTLSYTHTRSRDQTAFAASGSRGGGGFGGFGFGVGSSTTAGDPNAVEWGRSDLERRHALSGSMSWFVRPWLDVTSVVRVSSGTPYTPRVGGDINGDGARNDRAFVFDPASAPDTAIANGMARLLAGAPGAARECLLDQMGRIAARNSCAGAWTPSLDLQFNVRPDFGGTLGRRLTFMVALVNPLAGLDLLLHGGDGLRGWGQPSRADATLLYVRGFDPVSNRYLYEVNERFGDTRGARTAIRNPFQIGLQMRLQVGPDRQREMLMGALGRARLGGPATRDLNARMLVERVAPDPIGPILERRDSLGLTDAQVMSLKAISDSLFVRVDSIATRLQAVVDSAGENAELRTLFPTVQPTLQRAREDYVAAVRAAEGVLTAEQWALLPDWLRNPAFGRRAPGPQPRERRG
ncbi:MAG TPA: carboxypeptidase regulatory-like domain-containing protein, partial [Gemmatimonadaceae bacterium]|nr:carboxypeptidase regulatory-like domain-containing protein [Gemmatimonadaceae bacterium]